MVVGDGIWIFPKMKNEILGARCCFGSYTEWGHTKTSKCNFRVTKCSLEAHNGNAGTQAHFDSTKCDPKVKNTPMVHLGLVWV